ncbi:capsular exopolysaccharide family domain protein (plasmid) [Bacillus cereus]|nr:capsular exopolysaccharide family domain protein [Bacillus cereus]AJI07963.1 capsular exopolysaccharide family domain protein [Bacillus cereus G9241]
MIKKKKKLNSGLEMQSVITKTDPQSPISEQYRIVRTNISFLCINNTIRSLIVTSPEAGEGKSTTAVNLAVVFSQQGKRVLFVNADLRKQQKNSMLEITDNIGLTDILTGEVSLTYAVKESNIENLYLLNSGYPSQNPSELLGSARMEEFLQEAYQKYDMIIFDTPPMLTVSDSQVMANQCDGIILVVDSGKTKIESAVKTKKLLQTVKGKLLGVVLNNCNNQ